MSSNDTALSAGKMPLKRQADLWPFGRGELKPFGAAYEYQGIMNVMVQEQ